MPAAPRALKALAKCSHPWDADTKLGENSPRSTGPLSRPQSPTARHLTSAPAARHVRPLPATGYFDGQVLWYESTTSISLFQE